MKERPKNKLSLLWPGPYPGMPPIPTTDLPPAFLPLLGRIFAWDIPTSDLFLVRTDARGFASLRTPPAFPAIPLAPRPSPQPSSSSFPQPRPYFPLPLSTSNR